MMQSFIRLQEVYAAQLEKETMVQTKDGMIEGQKGDYLVMEAGVPRLMSKSMFEKTHYRLEQFKLK